MTKKWYKRRPELVESIRRDLAEHFPSLHLFIDNDGAEVRGTFPVRGPNGSVIDEYLVKIELRARFPDELPVVREIGGRIPRIRDRHVNEKDGTACVLLPDTRWESFPVGAPFLDYLNGPLQNFFLGQSHFEVTGDWPFDEWGHGKDGIVEYYSGLLGVASEDEIRQYLRMLSRTEMKGHWQCPCRSGKAVRDCCRDKINDLRAKIPSRVARTSLRYLEPPPVSRGPRG